MNFRLKMVAWWVLSVVLIVGLLFAAAHWHLDGELRKDGRDRSHPRHPEWTIHGSYTDAEVQDILGELMTVWLWIAVPLLGASVGVGYFIAARSLRPVRRINRELAELDPLSCARGVQVPERDAELAALVSHINDLLGRVGKSYREMADFSARVAHELRLPLTLLRLRLEALAPELPPEVSEDLQEEIRQLSQLVERSLLMAKAEGGTLEHEIQPVDLSALLEDLHDGYAILAVEAGLTLGWQPDPALSVRSDPALLRQILHNLLGNAIRHGKREIRLDARPVDVGRRVRLAIRNRIAGGDTSLLGTGMGLRLVRAIIGTLIETTFQAEERDGVFEAVLELPGGMGEDGLPATEQLGKFDGDFAKRWAAERTPNPPAHWPGHPCPAALNLFMGAGFSPMPLRIGRDPAVSIQVVSVPTGPFIRARHGVPGGSKAISPSYRDGSCGDTPSSSVRPRCFILAAPQ